MTLPSFNEFIALILELEEKLRCAFQP